MRRGYAALFAAIAFSAGCSLFSDLGGFSENPAPTNPEGGGAETGGPSGTDATPNDDSSTPTVDAGPDASKYTLEVLADKPIAYWPFDDAPGSAFAKELVGGKNAEFPGTAGFGVAGVSGTAMNKTDVSQVLSVGDYFDFVGFDPFSIEAWAKPSFDKPYVMVIAKRRPNQPYGWLFYFQKQNPQDVPGFQMLQESPDGGSRTVFVETPNVSDAFHHIVVTFDPKVATGAHLRMYYDGVRTDGFDDGKPSIDTAEPVEIARDFVGLLDEVALYDHALSVERVQAHYQAGKK